MGPHSKHQKIATLCTQADSISKGQFWRWRKCFGITQDWKWDFFHNSSMHPLFDSRDDGG